MYLPTFCSFQFNFVLMLKVVCDVVNSSPVTQTSIACLYGLTYCTVLCLVVSAGGLSLSGWPTNQ